MIIVKFSDHHMSQGGSSGFDDVAVVDQVWMN